jgi:hypothetical protein
MSSSLCFIQHIFDIFIGLSVIYHKIVAVVQMTGAVTLQNDAAACCVAAN